MKIQMRANLIGVEKLGRASKHTSFIAEPEVTESMGVIRYLGKDAPEDLKVGMKVFYGKDRQAIRMGDADIVVMAEDNVFARVEETLNEEGKKAVEEVV